MTSLFPRILRASVLLVLCQWTVLTRAAETPAPPKGPAPTVADVSYGSSPNQLLDIFVPPDAKAPCPVLIWYGGIWKPAKHAVDPNRFFPAHVAVVAVEPRTLTDGLQEKANPPVSYVMNDAVRAVHGVSLGQEIVEGQREECDDFGAGVVVALGDGGNGGGGYDPTVTISRHIYGHFSEHLGRCIYGGFWVPDSLGVPKKDRIRLDVVEAVLAAQAAR